MGFVSPSALPGPGGLSAAPRRGTGARLAPRSGARSEHRFDVCEPINEGTNEQQRYRTVSRSASGRVRLVVRFVLLLVADRQADPTADVLQLRETRNSGTLKRL